MAKENLPQELVDDLLTDPDRDAAKAPKPPQTVDAEPAEDDDGR